MTRKLSIIAGSGLFLLTAVLVALSPGPQVKMPNGFVTPIVAFEFIQNNQEAYDLMGIEFPETQPGRCGGISPESQNTMVRFDAINELDSAYILAYTAFMALLVALRFRVGQKSVPLLWPGIVWAICAVALCFDSLENVALLQITEALQLCQQWSAGVPGQSVVADWIDVLRFATHIKWAAIPAAFLMMHIAPVHPRPWVQRLRIICTASAVLALICAFISIFFRSFLNEVMGVFVALCFLLGYVEVWLDVE